MGCSCVSAWLPRNPFADTKQIARAIRGGTTGLSPDMVRCLPVAFSGAPVILSGHFILIILDTDIAEGREKSGLQPSPSRKWAASAPSPEGQRTERAPSSRSASAQLNISSSIAGRSGAP